MLKRIIRSRERKRRSPTPHPIHVRKIDFEFPEEIEKYWFGGSAVKTHVFNTITLLFPEGEQYFIRSVNRFRDRIEDPALQEAIRGFMQQEMQHSMQHKKYWHNLEVQGYHYDRFLALFRFFLERVVEARCGEKLNLAITAALEHCTAVLAQIYLEEEEATAEAQEALRKLFAWHSIEEIEHKGVAYDVLQEVDDRYLLRVAGMLIGFYTLVFFTFLGTGMFLVQDRTLLRGKVLRELAGFFFTKEKVFNRTFWALGRYLRPDFHPWAEDNRHLVDRALQTTLAATA
ncbi:MAG: metal-dependent hydrolase [Deltaproteobacteria bacterium]|nr:MAG: metal-dependent hydrolase [Deltaproteobacteria bacterium]